ncbi:hypothetical protein [Mariniphaga sediminis]|uniref:hypothetical protein n=1 Tax=Mariniphaga sediminis TaxID=1628158 RepID=UPI003566791E
MEITLKELCMFYGCSMPTARMRVKEIKEGLKLSESKKRILLIHVAKYEGLKVSEVKEIIKMYKEIAGN